MVPAGSYRIMDERVIAAIRLVLVVSALVSTRMDPTEPVHYLAAIEMILTLYFLYSAILVGYAGYGRVLISTPVLPWVDVAWYVLLISLSNGSNSLFFLFFFFAILVASFQQGFASGLHVTLVSTALFVSVGLAMSPAAPAFELNAFLLRSIMLPVLGVMMACWGGSETTLRRRLALLQEVSALANPRLGLDDTLGTILERLHAFYAADACLLILADASPGVYSLRRISRHAGEATGKAEPMSEAWVRMLVNMPADGTIVDRGASRLWQVWQTKSDQTRQMPSDSLPDDTLRLLRGALTAASFITLSFRSPMEITGRLYLTASRRRAFTPSDVAFLRQVLDRLLPMLDNSRLMERLAAEATVAERQRLARDLHDSVTQLLFSMTLIAQSVAPAWQRDPREGEHRLHRLVELGQTALAEMRALVAELRPAESLSTRVGSPSPLCATERVQRHGLAVVLRRHVADVARDGLRIDLETEGYMPQPLAQEEALYRIAQEALHNVVKHAGAQGAAITLATDVQVTSLIVQDNGSGFVPPSAGGESGPTGPGGFGLAIMRERAEALGGSVCVVSAPGAGTRVEVRLPRQKE